MNRVPGSMSLVTSLPLAQLVTALSGALDLTEGSPVGHSGRTCYIAMQIAGHLQLAEAQRYDLYYAALLKDAGGSSNAARLCALFGSADQDLKEDWRNIDWTSISALLGYLRRGIAPERSATGRLGQLVSLCLTGFADSRALQRTRCERGAAIVRKMGFSNNVAETVYALDEH